LELGQIVRRQVAHLHKSDTLHDTVTLTKSTILFILMDCFVSSGEKLSSYKTDWLKFYIFCGFRFCYQLFCFLIRCGIITYQQKTNFITAPLQHCACKSNLIIQTSQRVCCVSRE